VAQDSRGPGFVIERSYQRPEKIIGTSGRIQDYRQNNFGQNNFSYLFSKQIILLLIILPNLFIVYARFAKGWDEWNGARNCSLTQNFIFPILLCEKQCLVTYGFSESQLPYVNLPPIFEHI
jgi:hypothetical protein